MTAIVAGPAQLSFQRLLQHGYTTLFVASFAERLGVPLLVTPRSGAKAKVDLA